jgi:hypothetical protein
MKGSLPALRLVTGIIPAVVIKPKPEEPKSHEQRKDKGN